MHKPPLKLLTILGARPQFIKAAPLSRELKHHPAIQEQILHTGQHFDKNMSDVFFQELKIPKPTHHLNTKGNTHAQMTGHMLEGIEAMIAIVNYSTGHCLRSLNV